MHADHDLRGAEAEFRRALELDPGCYDAMDWMDELLRVAGRYQEAVEINYRALDLNPKDPATHSNLASSLWGVGRLEEAAAVFGAVIAMGAHLDFVARSFTDEPDGWIAATPSWFTEMAVYEDMGWSYQEAFEALVENLAAAGASSAELGAYRNTWGGLDWPSLWEADLARSQPVYPASYRARAHARLGQREQAVAALRQAWEDGEPGLLWLHGNPFFRDLEGFDPYVELMEELGLRSAG